MSEHEPPTVEPNAGPGSPGVTEVSRIDGDRGSSGRTRLVVAAWLLGLAAVVGIAVLGRVSTANDSVAAGPTVSDGVGITVGVSPGHAVASEPPTGAAASLATPGVPILLASPTRGQTITGVEVIVQGSIPSSVDSLEVSVEALGQPIDIQTVRPARGDAAALDAAGNTPFLVRLELPDPRPFGPLVVEVAAFDANGAQLGQIRRPFRVAPIDRPTLGDDGLLGSG